MSQENVEIVRRVFEAASDGEVGALFHVADPGIRVYPRSEEPDADDEYEGLDGLMDYLVNWYSQWDDYQTDPIEIIDAGKHVLVVARERGRVDRTGVEVEENFTHSFVLRDGKVVEWHMYDSHAAALEAVGLSESSDPEQRKAATLPPGTTQPGRCVAATQKYSVYPCYQTAPATERASGGMGAGGFEPPTSRV